MVFSLDTSEPAACDVINADGKSRVVLICDHASNRIPMQLGNLGIKPDEACSHIAWDPGALNVAILLAERFDAPLIHTNYSRLVADCNRIPEREDFIAASSAGVSIPGNLNISVEQRAQRRWTLFNPYHSAIDNLLIKRERSTLLLLSIHSFTPTLNGVERQWPIGVCYGEDKEWAHCWLQALQHQSPGPVGNNEPYAIESDIDYTLPVHGKKHRVPAIMLEIRQDEIGSPAGVKKWEGIISEAWKLCIG